jgi:hypothetical protein
VRVAALCAVQQVPSPAGQTAPAVVVPALRAAGAGEREGSLTAPPGVRAGVIGLTSFVFSRHVSSALAHVTCSRAPPTPSRLKHAHCVPLCMHATICLDGHAHICVGGAWPNYPRGGSCNARPRFEAHARGTCGVSGVLVCHLLQLPGNSVCLLALRIAVPGGQATVGVSSSDIQLYTAGVKWSRDKPVERYTARAAAVGACAVVRSASTLGVC